MDKLHNLQSTSYQGDSIRERSEVENSTDSLDKGLSELTSLILRLEQRLAPVTREANDKIGAGGSGATPMPQHSSIVMTLNSFTGRIQNEINKVNVLLNTIQL